MPGNGYPPRLERGRTDEALGPFPPPSPTPPDARDVFEANLGLVESVIRFVCHRQRLEASQAQEFESEVMLRLVERDYEVFRRFAHRSSLRTYLTVVIQRMFLDYRNRLWGKWRPSAEALRLGPVAIRLERLLARERYTFDEACEILRTNERVPATRSELADMAARLPLRTRPSIVGAEALDMVPQPYEPADGDVALSESRAAGIRIRRALAPAVQALGEQDRLILRLRFQDGLGVADIARALNLEQKPLYRRFESLLRQLRDALEAAGIDRDAARDAVSRKDVDISLALLGDMPPAKGAPVETRSSTDA